MNVWFLTITSKSDGYSVTSIFATDANHAFHQAVDYFEQKYSILESSVERVVLRDSTMWVSNNGSFNASLLPDVER